jgi:class 3 adenylate cyclase
MFSDLVGSTALSARMDPEDLREVISAYQNCVAETVRRFDGFVAKLVYFGYPQAHEDDAEREVPSGAGTGLSRKCAADARSAPVGWCRARYRQRLQAVCVDPGDGAPAPSLLSPFILGGKNLVRVPVFRSK